MKKLYTSEVNSDSNNLSFGLSSSESEGEKPKTQVFKKDIDFKGRGRKNLFKMCIFKGS